MSRFEQAVKVVIEELKKWDDYNGEKFSALERAIIEKIENQGELARELVRLNIRVKALEDFINVRPEPEPAPPPVAPPPKPVEPAPPVPVPEPAPEPNPVLGPDGVMVWAVGPAGSSTFLSRPNVLAEVVRSGVKCVTVHNMNTWHTWANPSLGQFDERHNESVIRTFRPITEQTGIKFAPLVTMSKVTYGFPLLRRPSDFNTVVSRMGSMAQMAARLSGVLVLDMEPYKYPDGGWIEYWNPSVQGTGNETPAYALGVRIGEQLEKISGLTVYWNHGFYQVYPNSDHNIYHLGARRIFRNSYYYLANVMAGMINAAPSVNFVNSMQLYALWHEAEMAAAFAQDKKDIQDSNFNPVDNVSRYKGYKRTIMAYNRPWKPAVDNIGRTMTHDTWQNVIAEVAKAKEDGTYAVGYAETHGSGDAEGLAYHFWKRSRFAGVQ